MPDSVLEQFTELVLRGFTVRHIRTKMDLDEYDDTTLIKLYLEILRRNR